MTIPDSVLEQAGYVVNVREVVAAAVPDKPGGLAWVLAQLAEHQIVVEYLYSFVRNAGDHALIIFRVDRLPEAEKILLEAGVKLLSQEEVRGL